MNKLPKLVIVDHSFHQKTKSTVFVEEILSSDFDISLAWDDSWKGEDGFSAEKINDLDCEYVLFFQVLPPIKELLKTNKKIIWMPMFDSCLLYTGSFWSELARVPIKIISFSKTLSRVMQKYGLDVLDVQYYPNPKSFKVRLPGNSKRLRIFFWKRGQVKLSKLCKLLNPSVIDKLIIKNDPDPGYEPLVVSKKVKKKYNIEIISGHFSREEYISLVESCDIFVAPRNFEGIGMSFLEPMAMGKVVIAPNKPTMNEYIFNKVNGYLYNPIFPKAININEVAKVGKESRKSVENGYMKWLNDIEYISEYIKGEYISNEYRSKFLIIIKIIGLPGKLYNYLYYLYVNSV